MPIGLPAIMYPVFRGSWTQKPHLLRDSICKEKFAFPSGTSTADTAIAPPQDLVRTHARAYRP